MSGYLPIPLEGNAVDPYAISLQYQKLLTAPVERGYTQAQTGLTQAQTTGEQIKNALGALNLQFRGQALGTAGNALSGQGAGPEPLPGQTEGSVYTPSGGGGGGSFQQVTGKLESGNDYAAVNDQGYSGKYQMGKGALAAAGIYQPAPREDMKAQGPGQWWGSFNIPGYDHPITYQQFLADPHAQDVAFGQHQQNLDHEIQSRGLSRYIGQTVAGVPITQDSLRSMMHGGGPEGTQRFIESGGQYNPADANGKTIASFGNRFAPGGGPAQRFSVGEQAAPPGQPYQVAQAGGGIQPPPGGGAGEPVSPGTGGPNALAQSNPMGTSSQGVVMPGTGVALPRQQVQLAYLSPDPSKALHDAMQDRRATLSQLAGGATDPRSWDQNVAQAWRMGYLTNADFQQLYGHFSPALKETVIRSMSSPETQVGYAQTLFGHGFDSGGAAGSPRADPYLKTGEAPITTREPDYGPPGPDGARPIIGYHEVTRSAPGYFSGPGAAGTPGQAASAPQGVHVLGSDGNMWHVPVGPGAGAPAQAPQPGGQPAPGAGAPVGQPGTPPPVAAPGGAPGAAAPPAAVTAPSPASAAGAAPGAAAPPTPTAGQPALPAAAIGGGNVTYQPNVQRQVDADRAQIDKDGTTVEQLQATQAASQQQQQSILYTRGIANGLPTGKFGEIVSNIDQYLASMSPSIAQDFMKKIAGLDVEKRASDWQELAKLTLQMAGQAESQVAGGHGGFNLVQLYKDHFPGLDTQPTAMRDMLNLFLVQHQYNVDHAQAASNYYEAARAANIQDPVTHPYVPLSVAADKPFLDPKGLHAPQVYVAATAILNNAPQSQAFAGLNDQQKVQAVRIAMSADPAMSYHGNAVQKTGASSATAR